ncbi:MAG: DUF4838 domain-containing protein [Lentisphaeria bacterium]|nr:DUF4838 domain-containing protein [Lentisphaeria bacterium]
MKILSVVLLVCISSLLWGGEFFLMKDGKAVSSIVLEKNASVVEKHAADELSKFLAKISGGERPGIGTAPAEGKYPIYIGLTDDPKVEAEGFKVSADKKGLFIQGKTPIGTVYGAYAVLKKFAGILWLLPGEDGEYFTIRPNISVPVTRIIENPDFKLRDISKVCMGWDCGVWDTWDWGLRQGMRFHSLSGVFNASKAQREGMLKRGIIAKVGGHCFSPLLVYKEGLRTQAQIKKHAEEMFREHPEYFPIVKGKRVLTYHGGLQPQPCTSNPDVIRIVAANAAHIMKKAVQPVALQFCNNDCTQWCECEKCLAQDPPEERKKGIVSTRYWLFANAVFKEVKKQFPEARFVGESYQNYSRAPKGVAPYLGEGLESVLLSNHRHCWKHALNDRNCPTNRWYFEYNKEWNDMGIPLRTYEEFLYAGRQFIPAEKNFVDELKFFRKHLPNVTGMETEICCPDGKYNKRFNTYLNRNNWLMMWQTIYMAMHFHWNIHADYDKEYEKINSLFYGKGWEGGMREFRRLLTDLYMNASGCHGYGHSTPLGKFLDVPGAKDKLYKLLDASEKAASNDLAALEKGAGSGKEAQDKLQQSAKAAVSGNVSDPGNRALIHAKRALAHVKKVREFFEMTWIKEYEKYITSFRTVTAYPLMDKIVIDGRLDEKDWRNADVTTRFRDIRTNALAKQQTAVKIAYDEDNIYIGIECEEPLPEEKLHVLETKHDGPIWDDNDVEIFLNDPILGSAYYQFIINSKGVLADGAANPRFDKSYESGAEVKTSFGKGKYFMEIRIPAKSITGSKITPGTVLKMNVLRERKPAKGLPGQESSTWSSGTPHSVDTFHPVTFAAPRQVSSGNRTIVDTRLWKNGSFDEVNKSPRIYKHWNLHGSKTVPANWSFSNTKAYGGDMEYLLHKGSSTNYFVRLRKGFIFSAYALKNDEITVVYRAQGKGTLNFRVLRKNTSQTIHKDEIDSADWKSFKFTFKRPGDKKEEQALILWPAVKGENYIDVDDIYLR